MRVYYLQTAVPLSELPQLDTKLLFVPFLDPAEAVVHRYLCHKSVQLGKALANVLPNTLQNAPAVVHDPDECEPQLKKSKGNDSADRVAPETTAWAEQREVAGLRPVGKQRLTLCTVHGPVSNCFSS